MIDCFVRICKVFDETIGPKSSFRHEMINGGVDNTWQDILVQCAVSAAERGRSFL